MKKRTLILLFAAVAITVLCVYASLRKHDAVTGLAADRWKRPAPVVTQAGRYGQLIDSENRLVRLQSFLGRHHIILVFVDETVGMVEDDDLRLLKDNFDALQSHDVKIIAITTLVPQKIRKNLENNPLPFPVVTDLEPRDIWHRLWKRYDNKNKKPLWGVFYIDRAGHVDWNEEGPIPVENLNELIANLKQGKLL